MTRAWCRGRRDGHQAPTHPATAPDGQDQRDLLGLTSGAISDYVRKS